jgi:hypothetical protein
MIVNPYLIKRGRNFDGFLDKLFFDIVKSDNKQIAEIKKFKNQLRPEKPTDKLLAEPKS